MESLSIVTTIKTYLLQQVVRYLLQLYSRKCINRVRGVCSTTDYVTNRELLGNKRFVPLKALHDYYSGMKYRL